MIKICEVNIVMGCGGLKEFGHVPVPVNSLLHCGLISIAVFFLPPLLTCSVVLMEGRSIISGHPVHPDDKKYYSQYWQYSAVQYSTAQRSTVQHSTVQYNTVQYSTAQYSTI